MIASALDWTAAHRPTAEQLREATEVLLSRHVWEGHTLFSVWGHPEEGSRMLAGLTLHVFAANVHPATYPLRMAEQVATLLKEGTRRPIVATTLQFEGDLIDEENSTRRRVVHIVTVGVGGGIDTALKFRDTGEVERGDTAGGLRMEGSYLDCLRAVAGGLPDFYTALTQITHDAEAYKSREQRS